MLADEGAVPGGLFKRRLQSGKGPLAILQRVLGVVRTVGANGHGLTKLVAGPVERLGLQVGLPPLQRAGDLEIERVREELRRRE